MQAVDRYGNIIDDPVPATFRMFLTLKTDQQPGTDPAVSGAPISGAAMLPASGSRVYARLENFNTTAQAYKCG